MKIGDRVTIHDRKMKVHGFGGIITSIDETLEKTKIYNVTVETKNEKGKIVARRNIPLLKNQIEKEVNV